MTRTPAPHIDLAEPAFALVRRALELRGVPLTAATVPTRYADMLGSLRALHLDGESLAAAVVAHASSAIPAVEEIREALGEGVANLVEGVLGLERIRWDRLEQEAPENLRKMFLAMAADVRVVLIALAHRVDLLRHLETLDTNERLRVARETQEIFAPLANRLGIWPLKSALEDLAFAAIEPHTYERIQALLSESQTERGDYVSEIIAALEHPLGEAGIHAKIKGRTKHIYSIYKKMRRKGVDFAQIYDVTAVRMIVDSVRDCYAALGVVHGLWVPIAGEFDDYIAKPKDNFYQSLHTAVIGPSSQPIEIQIRTSEMHEFAEGGVAAHWRYKEGGSGGRRADLQFERKLQWLRQLLDWQKELADPSEFAHSLKTDVFHDQVYVFTPDADVIDLPVGSTPLDFAYRVHTEVGHRCRGARVNGHIVPLDHALRTGDRVEIITTKHPSPSRDWLNPHLAYLRTSTARQKVRQWFRQQARETSVAQGRELLERELRRLGLEQRKVDDVASLLKFEAPEELLAALGFGDISTQQVAAKLLEAERANEPEPQRLRTSSSLATTADVSLAGVGDVLSKPAPCCHPVPGDAVVGYITRGRGLTIHRRDCPNLTHGLEPERLVELDWTPHGQRTFPVTLRITALDRSGLLRDVGDAVSSEGINLSAATIATDARERTASMNITLEIRSSDQLVRILGKLERLRDVTAVVRVTG